MMRPLYLQGRNGMRVIFDDPALAVSTADKTRQLFPLTRVSRVVVSGSVEWSMGALFACANAGVSVLFMDKSGRIKGRWLGRVRHHYSVLQSLSDLLLQNDVLPRYQNWWLGMQRMAARSAAKRLGFTDWQMTDMAVLQRWSQQALSAEWLQILTWLEGVVLSTVMQYLLSFGMDAESELSANTGIDLADDLSQILLVDFLPALVGWQKQYVSVPKQPVLLHLFEQRSARLDNLVRGALNKLHQCLVECG